MDTAIRFFLENKLVTSILLLIVVGWGIISAPFDWNHGLELGSPVAVDAIPDIGENQQIIYTPWRGSSPRDVEDQITFPLNSVLLGIPGVKTIRSSSVFGFSSIYLIFEDDVDFYWSRSRILEKLNSLPSGLLPEGVQPALGPDATALGQVFWYTLEGRDSLGNPTGGWGLHELRSLQDFTVKFSLAAVEGVAEVASIGGFVKEYQVDVDPAALQTYKISISQVAAAVRKSNRDIGAKTIEINQVEYFVRGLGYITSVHDIEQTVVVERNGVPILVRDLARVNLGPAQRRGVLDKEGAEVVGGVVVARYGANPKAVIEGVKAAIAESSAGMPTKILADGRTSKLTVVPFYDRSGLIDETIATLEDALTLELLITILVVIVLVLNLRASILIAGILPVAILMVFIAMQQFGVDANIVALSGIAIAIGTMVDLGIIVSENVLKHLAEAGSGKKLIDVIFDATLEVRSAILTAVATTIVSFIPVFALEAAEGRLFHPLAFTKTFALVAAVLVALFVLPALAHTLFRMRFNRARTSIVFGCCLLFGGLFIAMWGTLWAGMSLVVFGVARLLMHSRWRSHWIIKNSINIAAALTVAILLGEMWMPLGPSVTLFVNTIFVASILITVLGIMLGIQHWYGSILGWCLRHKSIFLLLPSGLIVVGITIWLGFSSVFGWIAHSSDMIGWNLRTSTIWSQALHSFPGIGKEFMPALDEGSFLLMPTSMAHAGVQQNTLTLQQLDILVSTIPEVTMVVGKLGRVESALDPAPTSMYENVINYAPEYAVDARGRRMRFRVDADGRFVLRDSGGLSSMTNDSLLLAGIDKTQLIPDDSGLYFRNWRSHIHSPDDIWSEIVAITALPGVTSAPKLQPIETRLVMLQTGMRAPMGIKVFGPNLSSIQAFGLKLEDILKQVSAINPQTVFAERTVGKPYINIEIDRSAIARRGINIEDVQTVIELAIGGLPVTYTVEGRERYAVRVRYPRELRDSPADIENVLVAAANGRQYPLKDLASIKFERGPQQIKSENTFLLSYVLFDRQDNLAEVDVIEAAQAFIQHKIAEGELQVPEGVSYRFSGNYENQVRAEKRLGIIIPLVLALIFLILYLQFRSGTTSLIIFGSVALAFSGGFVLIWLFGQEWFLNVTVSDISLRTLFNVSQVNLSVAVWVGFIALFGIATDDGVLIATNLDQSMRRSRPLTVPELHAAVVRGGERRIRPAVMTSATTIIALLPILTSNGRGADIMIPMAIPAVGGMSVAVIAYFFTPVLYCMREERKLKQGGA